MHFTYSLLALAAAVTVSAQGLPDIPPCALPCFATALTTDGCAGLTDFKCHCSKPSLISTITPCVAKACTVADQAKVQAAVVSTCQQAGVPINLPPVAGASSAASSSASTAPASSIPASSSTTPPASTTSTVVVSSSSAASSSAAAGPTFTTTSSAAAATTAAPTTAAASPTESANASSSVTPFTGGAPHVQGTLGGVAAALFAAAYYL